MRRVVLALVGLGSSVAAAERPAPVAMTGPYLTLAKACDAATVRLANVDVRCRLLDTQGTGAVLIVDYVGSGMRERDYVVVLRHDGAWWGSPSMSLDLSGNAWGGGNCCNGAASSPRYELWTPTGTGFAIALHTELHVWRVFRRNWGTGTGTDAGAHKLVGDFVFCGERAGDTPACIAVEAPHCAPAEQARIALTATNAETSCVARP